MTQITLDADFDANFESAFSIADTHLKHAIEEGGILAPYVAIAMIEAAVNAAVDRTESKDVIDILRDLANQVAADIINQSLEK